MTRFYLLIAGFIFQVFWGHLIDESNDFRWLMSWPKSSFGFPIISQGKNQTKFLGNPICFFPPPPPPKKNIYLQPRASWTSDPGSQLPDSLLNILQAPQIHTTFIDVISAPPLESFMSVFPLPANTVPSAVWATHSRADLNPSLPLASIQSITKPRWFISY